MADLSYHTIGWCWILFIVYWIISAFKVKAVAERQDWAASMIYKVPTIMGFVLLWRADLFPQLDWPLTPRNDFLRLTGAVLCVAGVLTAIWARRTLAGDWSSNVTFKHDHELVKTGPYRFARHPIYTGLLLMIFGTALAAARFSSWLGFVLMFVGFWIKLKEEEAVMLRHFPDTYPEYRRQVKAVIPFIL